MIETSSKPKPRGDFKYGVTRKTKTGCGNLYITVNQVDEKKVMSCSDAIGQALEWFLKLGEGK